MSAKNGKICAYPKIYVQKTLKFAHIVKTIGKFLKKIPIV